MNSHDSGDRLLMQLEFFLEMGLSNGKVAVLNSVPRCLKIMWLNEFLAT